MGQSKCFFFTNSLRLIDLVLVAHFPNSLRLVDLFVALYFTN